MSFDLAREGRDAAAIVEWVAGQDWCDGRVGAWGVSYGGMTALAAAAQRPASLRAIVAVYATTGRHRPATARRGTGGRGRAEHVVADDQPDAGPRHPGRRAALRAHLDQRR
jgi:putative CocE/NonD family hydrolase